MAVERYADVIVGPQLRTALLALTAAVFGLLSDLLFESGESGPDARGVQRT